MHDDRNTGAYGDYPMGRRRRLPDMPNHPGELLDIWNQPTIWTRFDTILRRIFMIGAIFTIWALFVTAMLYGRGLATHNNQPPPSDVYPSHAPSLLACDPPADDC